MSLCASCGGVTFGDTGICTHHHRVYEHDWAIANRIMCDFIHRGVAPPLLPPDEQSAEFWDDEAPELAHAIAATSQEPEEAVAWSGCA
ncbi:MAG TPA: hypothetical protein VFX28_09240 [Methylomirabilota bacterium]|nr:hypothetical protein [Methylomirabilota bacterium]